MPVKVPANPVLQTGTQEVPCAELAKQVPAVASVMAGKPAQGLPLQDPVVFHCPASQEARSKGKLFLLRKA